MPKRNFIPVEHFCEKYDTPIANVYTHRFQHKPKGVFKKGRYKGDMYIDEYHFIHRKEFQRKVWLRSHDNYYEIAEHISDKHLAYILARYTGRSQASWVTFLSQELFSLAPLEGTIFNYKIKEKLWEFWRVTTLLLRRIKRLW